MKAITITIEGIQDDHDAEVMSIIAEEAAKSMRKWVTVLYPSKYPIKVLVQKGSVHKLEVL